MSYSKKKHVSRKKKTSRRCKSFSKLFNFNGGWKIKSINSRNKTISKSRKK